MDGKSQAITKAGYIICSVSHRAKGEDWQDGGERAFKIDIFEKLYDRIPEIGETIVDHSREGQEINYTRTQ